MTALNLFQSETPFQSENPAIIDDGHEDTYQDGFKHATKHHERYINRMIIALQQLELKNINIQSRYDLLLSVIKQIAEEKLLIGVRARDFRQWSRNALKQLGEK
jgi:hypothetical protein